MEYIFLIIGTIFGLLFGLFIGAWAGAEYIIKRMERIDKEIESNIIHVAMYDDKNWIKSEFYLDWMAS